jgi:hypothetical protein
MSSPGLQTVLRHIVWTDIESIGSDMATALYILGCVLFGGGTVAFLRRMPDAAECSERARSTLPPATTDACTQEDSRRPRSDANGRRLEDFRLWECELRSDTRSGCEHDQRGRRAWDRWEREARRRRREEGR